ncbi:MAG TPA: vWA domain-containing protein [Kofleriaceae bacterium]|nr:vWA domain-containing protein [Kofleriaceae bacterium]
MFSCRLTFLGLLCAASLALACGDDGASSGPCETDPIPSDCGATCDEGTPCASGFYCGGDGTCTADCTAGGGECDEGEACSLDGQCVPAGTDDSGDAADDSSDGGDDGSDDGGDDDCPAVQVNLTPVVPVVVMLIDQSGSMDEPFGTSDRWESLKDALIGNADDGVMFDLQSQLNMGASLYTSHNGDSGGDCPLLQEVGPAINNASAIASLLEDNGPDDDTPTAEAVTAATASFPASDNPRIMILATDGNPDSCVDPDAHTPETQAASETAVQGAFDADITTFVLSVGDDIALDHLQRLANAGQGLDLASGDAQFYLALDPAALVAAFEEIIGGIRTCEIDVDGDVDLDRADEGTVVLNGDTLEYGTDWNMQDSNSLILLGDACDTFLGAESVALTAEFPCGGVVVVD